MGFSPSSLPSPLSFSTERGTKGERLINNLPAGHKKGSEVKSSDPLVLLGIVTLSE